MSSQQSHLEIMEKSFKFNANELNQNYLLSRSHEEANEIFAKPSTRRGRSYEEILKTVLYGHVAEVFLIEKMGFTDDTRKYKDVINTAGKYVEVKVTEGDYYVPYVLERAVAAKKESWRKYPDLLYIFIGDKKTGDYSLHGIYEWNGKNFILQN